MIAMSTNGSATFGSWLKTNRRAQDLTQSQLAQRVGCAEITIRKIEANQLRPSRHLVNLLLDELQVPQAKHQSLIQLARQKK